MKKIIVMILSLVLCVSAYAKTYKKCFIFAKDDICSYPLESDYEKLLDRITSYEKTNDCEAIQYIPILGELSWTRGFIVIFKDIENK